MEIEKFEDDVVSLLGSDCNIDYRRTPHHSRRVVINFIDSEGKPHNYEAKGRDWREAFCNILHNIKCSNEQNTLEQT